MNTESFNSLQNNGYVIIPSVLTPKEVSTIKDMFYEWQKNVHDLERQHAIFGSHGIFKYHQIGHQKHAWTIRTHPKVIDVFKALWGTSELVTSFDGTCYYPADLSKKRDPIWTHTDQAPNKSGLCCYQAFVALTSNIERTLVVYDGSHLEHDAYFKERGIMSNTDWQQIDHEWLFENIDRKRTLKVNAGDLVIWDSRTFHQNQYGKLQEERIVQYVCYLPKNHPKNTPAMQNKRRKYFQERRTTSHWPYPIRVNSKQPNTYGDVSRSIDYDNLPPIDLESMTDEIEQLL